MKFSINGSRHSSGYGSEDIHSEGSMISRISFDEQIPSNYLPIGNTISNSIATWDFPSNQPGLKTNLNKNSRSRVYNMLSRKTVDHGMPYSPRKSNDFSNLTMNLGNTSQNNMDTMNKPTNYSGVVNNNCQNGSCSSSDCSTRSCGSFGHNEHQKVTVVVEEEQKLKSKKSNLFLPVMNTPTLIEHGNQKFLIMDAPTNDNIGAYISELQKHGVTALVRTCERSYDDTKFTKNGIAVQEMMFPDGEAPPTELIKDWLSFVNNSNGAIAVHCVAGLGRGPVLVAIALIQRGMKPSEAVAYIRERRRGAINRRQLQYLESFKCHSNKRSKCLKRCSIM